MDVGLDFSVNWIGAEVNYYTATSFTHYLVLRSKYGIKFFYLTFFCAKFCQIFSDKTYFVNIL